MMKTSCKATAANIEQVLYAIDGHMPVTRQQIAELTSLSQTTVNNSVRYLLKNRIVKQARQQTNITPGPAARLIVISHNYMIVTIDMSRSEWRLIFSLFNMQSELVCEYVYTNIIDFDDKLSRFLSEAKECVNTIKNIKNIGYALILSDFLYLDENNGVFFNDTLYEYSVKNELGERLFAKEGLRKIDEIIDNIKAQLNSASILTLTSAEALKIAQQYCLKTKNPLKKGSILNIRISNDSICSAVKSTENETLEQEYRRSIVPIEKIKIEDENLMFYQALNLACSTEDYIKYISKALTTFLKICPMDAVAIDFNSNFATQIITIQKKVNINICNAAKRNEIDHAPVISFYTRNEERIYLGATEYARQNFLK